MGGFGSGRWRPCRKITVEECYFVDISDLFRQLYWTNGKANQFPVLVKTNWGLRKKKVGTIDFALKRKSGKAPILILDYMVTVGDKTTSITEHVHLDSSVLISGGLRWWFTCPIINDGLQCGRLAGKLYLPPGAFHFGCRHCHDLTYQSCQENHNCIKLFRK